MRVIAPLSKDWLRLLAPGGIVVAAIALLFLPIKLNSDSAVVRAFINVLHLPLFSIIAVASCVVIHLATGFSRRVSCAISFALCVVVALGSEVIQGASGRDPSWTDAGNNLTGLVIGHLAVLAWWHRGKWLWALVGVTLVGVWVASLPVQRAASAKSKQSGRLPVLGRFEHDWELLLWRPQGDVGGDDTEISFEGASGERRLRVEGKGAQWVGVFLLASGSDWSGYEALQFELEIEGAPPPLGVRLDLGDGTRFRSGVDLKPGRHTYAVPFDGFRASGESALVGQLSDVARLVFHFGEAGFRGTYFLDEVTLN